MENQNETQKNPQYKYASTREKLCFELEQRKDAICNLVGAFLMLYFIRYIVSGTGICRHTVFCSKNMGCDQ